jgi:hypothetical protein
MMHTRVEDDRRGRKKEKEQTQQKTTFDRRKVMQGIQTSHRISEI